MFMLGSILRRIVDVTHVRKPQIIYDFNERGVRLPETEIRAETLDETWAK